MTEPIRTIATAGHVDHGKSSLVRTLTGVDPDRFAEERARGLTIDLGFAFTTIGDTVVGFVDVPGHVRFAKNMLAGIGAVEIVMLVVAANEGWMPQTEEHHQIIELLGIEHGLVVLTKADLVDSETLEIAQLEIADHLDGTAAASWPVVTCDARAEAGVERVRAALAQVIATTAAARDEHRPRLWIDRSFSAKGAGTIVTGTLAGGALALDDELVVEPHHRPVRVRGIQIHHRRVDRVEPGARVALNLAGVEHDELARGDAVVRADQWAVTDRFDARVRRLPGFVLPRRTTIDVHVGSRDVRAALRVLADGDEPLVRFRLDAPVPLRPGDRVVLRSTGRRATVGAAEVLDVRPATRTRAALDRLARPLAVRVAQTVGWARPADFLTLAGLDPTSLDDWTAAAVAAGHLVAVGSPARYLTAERAAALTAAARTAVTEHHRRDADAAGLELARLATTLHLDPAQVRALVERDPTLLIERELVRDRAHEGAASQTDAGRRLLAALAGAPFAPPTLEELSVDVRIARRLVREGAVVEIDGLWFDRGAVDDATARVVAALRERERLTVAEIRDLLGSTRKYTMAIVAHLDRTGVTRRRGDDRIAGPRGVS